RPAPAPNRGRAVLVAMAVAAVIAVPAVGSQVVGNPFDGGQTAARSGSAHAVRGGVARAVHTPAANPPSSPGATGSSGVTGAPGGSGSGANGPGGTAGSPGTTTAQPPTKIIPRSRAHGAASTAHPAKSQHAKIVPQRRLQAEELPHTT
ncbi:MAG: hypothetical protein QOK36_3988, partial [Gaiellales bacterium]|nr:hypothetical protein [Gaiellales bacterium]